MALDTTKTNIGYRLGRLYAVIEAAAKEQSAEKRATDYDQAVLQPHEAFPRMIKKANDNGCDQALVSEIMKEIQAFPTAPLANEEQGEFTLGYYHQKAELK